MTPSHPTRWLDFACRMAEAADLPRRLVCRVRTHARLGQAARPCCSARVSERGVPTPGLAEAVERFFGQTPGLRR